MVYEALRESQSVYEIREKSKVTDIIFKILVAFTLVERTRTHHSNKSSSINRSLISILFAESSHPLNNRSKKNRISTFGADFQCSFYFRIDPLFMCVVLGAAFQETTC
jgi:hypothetical protein